MKDGFELIVDVIIVDVIIVDVIIVDVTRWDEKVDPRSRTALSYR